MALYATTVELAAPVDLIELAGDDGWLLLGPTSGIAAWGTAAELEVTTADHDDRAALRRLLGTIDHDDQAGVGTRGIVAMGAIPFDLSAPCRLTVPRCIVQLLDDGRWVMTSISTSPEIPVPPPPTASAVAPLPQVVGSTSIPLPQGYRDMVSAATKHIADGAFVKVVLARRLVLELDGALSVADALHRLAGRDPRCTIYAAPVAEGRLFGASPELIVAKRGTSVRSNPLAGSVAIDGTADDLVRERALETSAKTLEEHDLVVQDLAQRLGPLCEELHVARPSLVQFRSIAHLSTVVKGTTASYPEGPSALDLVAAIAPTPAVGGVPTTQAAAEIDALEPFDRGSWAGAVGWVDAGGDGQFMLAIRGATLEGRTLTLTAGCGIVRASDPTEELEETRVKFRAVLDVVLPRADLALW